MHNMTWKLDETPGKEKLVIEVDMSKEAIAKAVQGKGKAGKMLIAMSGGAIPLNSKYASGIGLNLNLWRD